MKLSHSMNGSNVWGSLEPLGDVLSLFKWNIYKKIKYSFMKLRIIAVPVGNEIKKFPNDTWHLFFLLG